MTQPSRESFIDDDLRKITQFVRLARRTGAVFTQKNVLPLGIIAIFLTPTFTGRATLRMAVSADMGASFILVRG